MEINFPDLSPFFPWLSKALMLWILGAAMAVGIILVLGWIIGAIRYGPLSSLTRCFGVLRNGVIDLVLISPRRVGTLAWLAIKESLRRWVVVAVGIFLVMILFAGWFLDPGSVNPARLYLGFVLTSTSYLMLILVWLLSAMSLPADFSNHTIQTLVTKPVRSSEIVLGRILGFTLVSTGLLALIGVVSFFFVTRGLAHTHDLPALSEMRRAPGTPPDEPPTLIGKTSTVQNHWHKVIREPSGEIRVEMAHGHTHPVLMHEKDDHWSYSLGNAEGWLQARVPVYGELSFLDRNGQPAKRGINVGNEWEYKSFIEGGTSAAAIWTLKGITPELFPHGLLVEMDLSVFRSYKGDIERGIPGSLTLRNPKTGLYLELPVFEALEYRMTRVEVPRQLETPEGKPLDLFRDLTDHGTLEIQLRCEQPAQYFGVAQNNLYVRARDASFWQNFAKGYLGIWMQMVMVISLGVFFSTFLSAPIALVSTLGVAVGGFFHQFLLDLATGKTWGGGPFESIYRILTQENQTSELSTSLIVSVLKALDGPAELLMHGIATVLPDFSRFDFSDYVANGFDIPGNLTAKYFCRMLGFVLPLFVAGYFCLRGREVAR